MECFAGFLVVSVLAIWVLVQATRYWGRRFAQRQSLAHLARAFGGSVRSGGIWFAPEATIFYGDTKARVTFSRAYESAPDICLRVAVGWPFATEACELNRPPHLNKHRSARRAWQRVAVPGDFGQQWEVVAENASESAALLTSGVQWQAERLAKLGLFEEVHILISEGEIVAAKQASLLRGEAPAQFVQGVLEFYDQCMLAKATGIEFLHPDEAQPLEHVRCNICGEEILDQMVVCRRCRTPHHEDCWHYTGSCSVFGCRETRFT